MYVYVYIAAEAYISRCYTSTHSFTHTHTLPAAADVAVGDVAVPAVEPPPSPACPLSSNPSDAALAAPAADATRALARQNERSEST